MVTAVCKVVPGFLGLRRKPLFYVSLSVCGVSSGPLWGRSPFLGNPWLGLSILGYVVWVWSPCDLSRLPTTACEMQLMVAPASQEWLKELGAWPNAKVTGLASAPGLDCLRIHEE